MGLFWDLIQQSQIGDQKEQTQDLQAQVQRLEQEVIATKRLLHSLVVRLEEHFGEDLNKDGRIG